MRRHENLEQFLQHTKPADEALVEIQRRLSGIMQGKSSIHSRISDISGPSLVEKGLHRMSPDVAFGANSVAIPITSRKQMLKVSLVNPHATNPEQDLPMVLKPLVQWQENGLEFKVYPEVKTFKREERTVNKKRRITDEEIAEKISGKASNSEQKEIKASNVSRWISGQEIPTEDTYKILEAVLIADNPNITDTEKETRRKGLRAAYDKSAEAYKNYPWDILSSEHSAFRHALYSKMSDRIIEPTLIKDYPEEGYNACHFLDKLCQSCGHFLWDFKPSNIGVLSNGMPVIIDDGALCSAEKECIRLIPILAILCHVQ